ncbi:hypothetical protein ABBQ38_001416 [Trebouxia sp. C0009 RCD-2024]
MSGSKVGTVCWTGQIVELTSIPISEPNNAVYSAKQPMANFAAASNVHVPSLLGQDQPQAGTNPKLCDALNLFGQNLSNGFNNILQNYKGDRKQ